MPKSVTWLTATCGCMSRRVCTSFSGTGGVGMETVSMLIGDRQLTQVASNLKN